MARVMLIRTWAKDYAAVVDGRQRAEIRLLDREYKPGDQLLLQEVDATTYKATGREQWVTVATISKGKDFEVTTNFLTVGVELHKAPAQ